MNIHELEARRDELLELLISTEAIDHAANVVGAKQAAKNERERILHLLMDQAPPDIKTLSGRERWAKMQIEYEEACQHEAVCFEEVKRYDLLWEALKQCSVIISQKRAEDKERDRI